ncbi:MAG: 50S ribosomal protein L24e [Candidatus Micrarchaeota archaeon]|nr:50S ribosomal protein L24e [Candidatus Micrarchaeota archaeon]MBU1681584.1 50S ribosomal protein L24e [Candidatus Micrarchaeota archaeon]
MVRCSFSATEIEKGKGLMYVKKDGTIYYFNSSKEKKNFVGLKREGRRQKWTIASREFKESQAKKKTSKKTEKKK